MTLNTPCAFIVREENKIHIVHIACLLQLKSMRVTQSKFTLKQTQKYFQMGAPAWWAGLRSAFDIDSFLHPIIKTFSSLARVPILC